MDEINQLVSPETQALILQVLALLSLLMPGLQKLVEKTENTWDNKALEILQKILNVVPRVRGGSK